MNRIELVSRRTFLGGMFSAGALVLGARLLPPDVQGAVEAAWSPSVYLGLEPDGTVIIVAHRSEMGTGIRSVLPTVLADELDADWKRVKVEQALGGLSVRFAHNADYAQGLGTSLRAGIAAVPPDADGAIVCLGDMPQVDSALIDRLIAAFDPERGALIVVPTFQGARGNPVIWARRFFPDLMAIEGDVGARHLIGRYGEAVSELAVTGKAALVDVDTPEALRGLKAEIENAVPE